MAKFLNGELPSNYHLTFSRSEHNQSLVDMVLLMVEIAGFPWQLPRLEGVEVINGDENDLLFETSKVLLFPPKKVSQQDETDSYKG